MIEGGNELLALSICHENSDVRFTPAKGISSHHCVRATEAAPGWVNKVQEAVNQKVRLPNSSEMNLPATAIEYGLIAAGISVAIIAVVPRRSGRTLNATFGGVSTALK